MNRITQTQTRTGYVVIALSQHMLICRFFEKAQPRGGFDLPIQNPRAIYNDGWRWDTLNWLINRFERQLSHINFFDEDNPINSKTPIQMLPCDSIVRIVGTKHNGEIGTLLGYEYVPGYDVIAARVRLANGAFHVGVNHVALHIDAAALAATESQPLLERGEEP